MSRAITLCFQLFVHCLYGGNIVNFRGGTYSYRLRLSLDLALNRAKGSATGVQRCIKMSGPMIVVFREPIDLVEFERFRLREAAGEYDSRV